MSTLIMAMFNKLGSISGKTKPESGYAFDKYGIEQIEGITVMYHDGAMDVKYEVNEKIYRERRNTRRRELYQNLREQEPDTFEAKQAYKREKYKNKGN